MSALRVRNLDFDLKCFELKEKGYSYGMIGERFSIHPQTARNAVKTIEIMKAENLPYTDASNQYAMRTGKTRRDECIHEAS